MRKWIASLVVALGLLFAPAVPAQAVTGYRSAVCVPFGASSSSIARMSVTSWLIAGGKRRYHVSATTYRVEPKWGPDRVWHLRYVVQQTGTDRVWRVGEFYVDYPATAHHFVANWNYSNPWPAPVSNVNCGLTQ